jgi:hypothetical protein
MTTVIIQGQSGGVSSYRINAKIPGQLITNNRAFVREMNARLEASDRYGDIEAEFDDYFADVDAKRRENLEHSIRSRVEAELDRQRRIERKETRQFCRDFDVPYYNIPLGAPTRLRGGHGNGRKSRKYDMCRGASARELTFLYEESLHDYLMERYAFSADVLSLEYSEQDPDVACDNSTFTRVAA